MILEDLIERKIPKNSKESMTFKNATWDKLAPQLGLPKVGSPYPLVPAFAHLGKAWQGPHGLIYGEKRGSTHDGTGFTWDEAKAACEERGTRLLSKKEGEKFLKLIKEQKAADKKYVFPDLDDF